MNFEITSIGRVKEEAQPAVAISGVEEIVSLSTPYLFGVGMVFLMALIYIWTWVGLFPGIGPGITGLGLAAAVLTILAVFFMRGRMTKRLSVAVAAPICVLVLAGLGSVRILDTSYDGLAYHQSAVLALQNGWKPIFGSLLGASLWENHYPKASWIVGAALSSSFQSVEAMKAQNVTFMLAAFCLAFAAIRACFPGLQRGIAILFAFVVAANPVSLYQAMTAYNDGLMASQITCAVALAVIAARTRDKTSVSALVLLLPYIINLKFTSAVYVAVLWTSMLAILVGWRMKDAAKFMIAPTAAACLSGIFLFGVDPYVTNFLAHGHPFYPVQGAGKVDIMANNLPSAFIGKSYIYKLLAGLFGVPDWAGKDQLAISTVPRLWYFKAFRGYDVRVGGFGPILCAVTVMLATGLMTCGRFTVRQWKLLAIALAIVISGVINPEAWWARYVPQLWAGFAGFALMLIIAPPSRTFARWLGVGVLSAMALNSLGIGAVASASVLERDREWRAALSKWVAQSNSAPLGIYLGTHSATWARLDSFGVRYSLVGNVSDCVDTVPLLPPPVSYLSTAKVCEKR
jgi:hypothetical protein